MTTGGPHLLLQGCCCGDAERPQFAPTHVSVQGSHVTSLELTATYVDLPADDELEGQVLPVHKLEARPGAVPELEWWIWQHADGETGQWADTV
eukprot:CAMPEP_0115250526 /NCGR_PEP_ID=MMETSP0270-20121206/43158_1 /TAXON_ID=71861 /ORGANISM="Scrippsiella trochoidea, Strain CCMP3099" /LENGTH=92 /DNA_ID=CAMNT_0002665915 /DNA_START=191 /DNA_END=469 /DNA_ORIENTATION=+